MGTHHHQAGHDVSNRAALNRLTISDSFERTRQVVNLLQRLFIFALHIRKWCSERLNGRFRFNHVEQMDGRIVKSGNGAPCRLDILEQYVSDGVCCL